MAKKASTPLAGSRQDTTFRNLRPLKARVLDLERQGLEGRLDALEKRVQGLEMDRRSDGPTVPTTSTMSIKPPDEDIDPDQP